MCSNPLQLNDRFNSTISLVALQLIGKENIVWLGGVKVLLALSGLTSARSANGIFFSFLFFDTVHGFSKGILVFSIANTKEH